MHLHTHRIIPVLLLLAILGTIQVCAIPAAQAGDQPFAAQMDSLDKLSAIELTALGARYEHAEGVSRDPAKAIALYCAAARKGHADAYYALGWMYAHGRGMPKDDSLARYFFEIAANLGHAQSRTMLHLLSPDTSATMPSCLQQESPESKADNAPPPSYPKGPIYELVQKLAPRYGIDPQLALAIIQVESAFNPRAVSPKNARGLMQLTPDTARRFSVKNPFDPEENIKGGLSYLQWLLNFFQGNVPLALAAYNAGERAVENHQGVPPYAETKNYVRKISLLYRKTAHPFPLGHVNTISLKSK